MNSLRLFGLDRHRTAQAIRIAILIVIGAVLCVLYWLPVIDIFAKTPINYNEGWNAYHVSNLLTGSGLYPSPDGFATNNYPPLSFYVTASVSLFVGDAIVAGRLIAIFSLFATAINLGLVVYVLSRSRFLGIVSGQFFLVFAVTWFNEYIAMADPQWLGHALQTAGLFVLMTSWKTSSDTSIATTRLAMCVALMFAGGLVKHNLMALPLAAAFWLFFQDRRAFLSYCALGLAYLIVTAAVCWWLFGDDVFRGVFLHAREISILRESLQLSWIITAFLPYGLFVGLLAILGWRDNRIHFITVYFVAALLIGLVALSGSGVNVNAMFDLAIASVIGFGVLAYVLAGLGSEQDRDLLICILLTILAVPIVAGLPNIMNGYWNRMHLHEQHHEASLIIETIRATDGPVVCEHLAWCYWAGKPFEIDFFNYGQKIKSGRVSPVTITDRFQNAYFKRVEAGYVGVFGDAAADAFEKNYSLEKQVGSVKIFVPKIRHE